MNLSIFNFKNLKQLYSLYKGRKEVWWTSFIFLLLIPVLSGAFLNQYVTTSFRPNQRTEAVKALSKNTEVLFLGPSHFFTGIAPREIDKKSVTLSTGSLNYLTQLVILKKHLPKLKGLKLCVLELDNVPLTINTTHNRMNRFEGDLRDLVDFDISYYEIPNLNFYFATLFRIQDIDLLRPLFKGPKFSLNKKMTGTKKKKNIIPGFIPYKDIY